MRKFQETILISGASIFLVVFFDRMSKLFFINLLSLGESIPVIRNIFHWTLVHNTGIAFGLFKEQGIFFLGVSLFAIGVFGWLLYHQSKEQTLSRASRLAFSLIIGGALGNFVDRLQFGFVIDFIDFRIWPVFNIADSAITIGACILILTCIPLSAK
jgi:signal peptidase II